MLGRPARNEGLYMKREFGGRGFKSLREFYEETRSRVWCYMFVSDDMWIKEALKQETRKECNSVKDEAMLALQAKNKTVHLGEKYMKLE